MRTLATASDGKIKINTDLDASGFEKGLKKLGGLAKTGLSVITTGVAAVSAGLLAAGGYAVKVGSDFESGMSEVAAISGATGEELQALTDKAKEMGSMTKFSATESAEALKYMAMAGWDTDKMLSGLPGVMNLAAASGENLGTVSDIVTDSMTAFGMAAGEAGHFADVLAQASSKSNTNVALMGETFKYVAPVAGALGYSAEDAAVAIGLMANSGIKGSQAGTALRSTLSRLAKPTDEVQGAMDKLKISLTDSEGNMKSLGDVMQDMRKGFQGLTEDQKAQYAAALAGQEGMSGLLAIVNTSDENFNALADAINNADGAAETMASVMQDNLKGAVTIAKSALEGLGISIYESLEDPLKETVQTATGYLNQLQSAFDENGLSGAVSELGTILSDLVKRAAEAAPELIRTAVELIGNFVSGIREALPDIADAALEIVDTLLYALFDALTALPEIAGEIITTLGTKLAEYAPELIPAAVECILEFVQGLIDQLPGILDVALQLVRGLADGILAAIPELITALPALIDGIVQFLVEGIPQLIETVIYIVEQIVANLPTIIAALIEALPQIIESLVSGLMGCIGQLVAGAIQLVVLLVTHLPEIISGLIQAIPQIVRAIIDGFTAALPSFKDAGKTIMGAMKSGIEEIWEKIRTFFSESIPKLINSIGEWFSELPGRVKEWLDDTLRRVSEWASGMDGKAEEAGRQFITAVINFVKTLPEKIRTWLRNTIVNVTSFVSDFGKKATQAGQSFLTNIVSKVKQIPGQMLSIGKNIVTGIWNGISGAAGWLYNQVAGFARGIISGIKSALGIHSPSRIMKEAVGAMLPPGISEGFTDALPAAEKSMEKQLGSMTDRLSGISVPAIVRASMDGETLNAMQAAVEFKTAQTASSVSGDPTGISGRLAALTDKFDALLTRLESFGDDRLISLSDLREALKGLRVEMDGRDVGEIVDERLGELYGQRERGEI